MKFKDKLKKRAKKSTLGNIINKFSVYDVIKSPIVTEKSHKLQEEGNKYSFVIHKDANKNDVKMAVKILYNVNPLKVNIVKIPSKGRMQRKLVRRGGKKAYIKLAKKEKIDPAT